VAFRGFDSCKDPGPHRGGLSAGRGRVRGMHLTQKSHAEADNSSLTVSGALNDQHAVA
jgi:hypothetical protein